MNHRFAAIFKSRYWVWLLLAAPGVYMVQAYLRDVLYYGEFLHVTGEFSARLLILTLAITPLRLLWPRAGWTRWLLRQRRYLGVATFGYALLHAAAYLARVGSLQTIAGEALEPGLATGWLALLLMAPLAATSLDAAVRWLGSRWKQLHRLVYAAAILTFAHWVLTAFNPLAGFLHAGILLAVELLRIVASRRRNFAGRA